MISSIHNKLMQPTSFFGIKLWITMVIIITILVLLLVLSVSLCLIFRRRRRRRRRGDIMKSNSITSMNRRLLSKNGLDFEMSIASPEKLLMFSDYSHSTSSSRANRRICDGMKPCCHYTFKEIDAATNGFCAQNLIGSEDYGVVYHGILLDNTHIAVKKLLVNRGRFRDFKGDVEAMWCIRHKNLVKLLGYCTEGTYRMLVYEYVDNGNLQQWLHESISKVSPLTWNIRMSIIEGTAKGLAYLHEDIEPAILHQHLKASNIMLDKHWNPKISDFGISNILGPDYLAAEYGDTGVLDVKSDVYSFGMLVMEIVSGKSSVLVQQSSDEKEECLVDWIKSMVSLQNFEAMVDPKLPGIPPANVLKRIILIALRCVDSDTGNRPNMSDIIHMLEPRDLLLSDV